MYQFLNLTENPIENVQLDEDPVVTKLVVGTPSRSDFPSSRLIRPIEVQSWTFKYDVYGVEHLAAHDTERAMRAEIKHSDWEADTATAKLRRFSWAIRKDADEIGNANPALRIRERSASQAREIVQRDIETQKKDFILDTTSYATGHDVTIAGGSEWDSTGGDSRTDVRTQAKLIFDKTGIPLRKIQAFVSDQALNAALDDPTFLSAHYNRSTDTPDVVALQRYWGIGEVFSANPTGVDSAGDVTHLYGDVCVLYAPSDHADFDTEYGEFTWAAQFMYNRGIAQTPFYLQNSTTWVFPWHEYSNWKLINNNCASLIRNCAA